MSMPHDVDLILTLAGGLTAATVLGFLTQKLRLSPLVGYLLAGVLVGPYSPGFVADAPTASQCAEIGIILLMFGVGLHFHLKDLLAVRHIAVSGALIQIAAATLAGAAVFCLLGGSLMAGLVFGMSISVASTVVLTRVMGDNGLLHTRAGHVALGWLVVEDLFTILLLVLLPTVLSPDAGPLWSTLGLTVLKLAGLTAFMLLAGQKLIPLLLGWVARTGTRDLFTLAVLALALGIAVGAALLFDASMALGAFLAGMVVGQSDFSARAAAEALPLRDAFAVLFFVSVGMLFDPLALLDDWPLMLLTFGIIVLIKPMTAFTVCRLFRRPPREALAVGLSLGQIGEFSFILAGVGATYGLFGPEVNNAVIPAAILSITLNPLLFPQLGRLSRWLEARRPAFVPDAAEEDAAPRGDVIVVGYGPTGEALCRILEDFHLRPVIIEANIDTVRRLRQEGRHALHGNATQAEVLLQAGLADATALLLTSAGIPAADVISIARGINPHIRIWAHTAYLSQARVLRAQGVQDAFSGEGEVALALSAALLRDLGAAPAFIDAERDRLRARWSYPDAATPPPADTPEAGRPAAR